MFIKYFEFLIAWRYLKSKRKDGFISVISWLSLIGITLGVATLVIVMSVMNGFREEMLSKILGINGHVTVMSSFVREFENPDRVIGKITSSDLSSYIKDGNFIIPIIEDQVMMSSEGVSMGGMLRAMSVDDMAKLSPAFKSVYGLDMEGNEFPRLERGDVVIGYQLANKLGVDIGDEITLTTARGNITAFGTVPRIKSYRVGAVFNTGMSIYDSGFVFMQLDDAQLFFDLENKVSHIEIFLNNPDDSVVFVERAKSVITPAFRAYTWQSQNSSFVSALNVERNVMFLILTLIILVASFNIISSLVMLVKEKSHDIAVFRTIGASRGEVMRIFFIAGSFIGVVGTFCGVMLGLLISFNIEWVRQAFQTLTGTKLFPDDVYFLTELPSKVEYNEVLWVVVMALAISFLATLYPSRKAAKQEPIDVLRYE
ncbi:lipoprotein-releasing ABC transporter permease subunit [bacterium]|nr:lipoprotein-releasing ABC transporter permease subunit [bacterium]MDE6224496.1 lipoprotein-releasing ABC transporter permease subunit [Alphaproteobacteria bacterium]